MIKKAKKLGVKAPKQTKKNLQIKNAVERAVRDYKEVFRRLAAE